MFRDGHIHTTYCPHGSKDSLNQYIERAIECGFTDITFTEHAPLPKNFIDPAPEWDSAMDWNDLEPYLKDVEAAKKQYKASIRIRTGLEVDFIQGFERETTHLLNEYGSYLDDSILSVHFLRHADRYYCVDFSEDEFRLIAERFGSVEAVYTSYYDTLLQSVEANLGAFKPERIGHITLVHKFQRMYPCHVSFDDRIMAILQAVKKNGYSLDYNGAGTVKPLCLESYPPEHIAHSARSLGIPLIYGSDAHTAAGIGQGFDKIDFTLLEGSV
ncbi:histidinol-phosphatase HisJ [Domibacillus mangrovi]|uniref:Histidinol-phosphatase n=1 Tax=Domibacillus mangrovi TaxID=1714354 RepID=A0A1Q5P7T9_9BACI|nr:histidinol-phosphatase HisJ [Domibacillus mangrovi]OKL38339.1 histidinol phosphatase [Domibacillus mangrovi]